VKKLLLAAALAVAAPSAANAVTVTVGWCCPAGVCFGPTFCGKVMVCDPAPDLPVGEVGIIISYETCAHCEGRGK
jgi:hypothetical protein